MGESIGRALIVEDDAALSSILYDFIEELGFSVTAASDVNEARRAFGLEHYQLLLTDLQLKDDAKAGIKLADEMNHDHVDTRVILVSGGPRPDELAADVPFLQKPFTMTQLQQAIDATH